MRDLEQMLQSGGVHPRQLQGSVGRIDDRNVYQRVRHGAGILIVHRALGWGIDEGLFA